MTDDTGKIQGIDPSKPIGKGNPPADTRFGGKRANKRNNKGRPRSFDALRALAQEIAAEPISAEEKMTRIEALLRVMSSSRNPADRRTFLEYAFGKPKEELSLSNPDGSLSPQPLPDEERLARMKQLAVMIAAEVNKKDA